MLAHQARPGQFKIMDWTSPGPARYRPDSTGAREGNACGGIKIGVRIVLGGPTNEKFKLLKIDTLSVYEVFLNLTLIRVDSAIRLVNFEKKNLVNELCIPLWTTFLFKWSVLLWELLWVKFGDIPLLKNDVYFYHIKFSTGEFHYSVSLF